MSASFIPRRDADLVNWGATFASKVSAAPTTYGCTVPQATELTGYQVEMNNTWLVTLDASTRSKVSIVNFHNARDIFVAFARKLARIIQACPTVTDGMRADLGLTVPKHREPMGPPGAIEDVKAALNTDGSLGLSWKCTQPRGAQGTMYQVWRQIDGGATTYVAGCGKKKLTDETLPQGVSTVTYSIQAVRGQTQGPWSNFVVSFGKSAAPSVTMMQPAKIAA